MSLFLTQSEREAIERERRAAPLCDFYWALLGRAERRAAAPGLSDANASTHWWYHALEALTDGAMAHALRPTDPLRAWLRDTSLAVARRPLKDWIGPAFRPHDPERPHGHLETAHLSVALAVVLDLASDLFTEAEQDELRDALTEKGVRLCRNWMEDHQHLNNWRCILLSGVAVPAAVLDREEDLAFATREYARCADAFQPDGSYGESLQYGDYALRGLVHTREALLRRRPDLDPELPMEPWVRKPRWDAASLLYLKPLEGWGPSEIPRSVNFNDSAAVYRPSADNLLHIAARARDGHPECAARARRLFQEIYVPYTEVFPPNRDDFGFFNDFGFLTLPLLPFAAPSGPSDLRDVRELETFSCGDVISRDSLPGRTLLAAKTGGDPLHAAAHLHGDLNSFILVHNQERLLVDPGHSCYRNLIHDLEASTLTHNTCTFHLPDPESDAPLQQRRTLRRMLDAPPVDRGARRLIAERFGDIAVIGSEASNLYGPPIRECSRFWLLCGAHVVFIIDRVRADTPVIPSRSWLLNNRDGRLDLKVVKPDRLVARKGFAGLKLFHCGDGTLHGPQHAHVHDAYNPEPARPTEGRPGSGALVRTENREARRESIDVHLICLDSPGAVAYWHLKSEEGRAAVAEDPHGNQWKLRVSEDFKRIGLRAPSADADLELAPEPDGTWSRVNP